MLCKTQNQNESAIPKMSHYATFTCRLLDLSYVCGPGVVLHTQGGPAAFSGASGPVWGSQKIMHMGRFSPIKKY